MVSKSEILTPLMKQYYGFKREHPDKIIFFRMGDFYEMFGEDAIKAAPILGVTLTSRSGANADHREPLAGVPYHSAEKYLSKLLRAGEKVVVVEQVEDPKTAKGIVKRDIVEILTPGTSTLEDETSKNASSYLAAIHPGSEKISGMAYLEMSTAEFKVMDGSDEQIAERMAILNPREIIFPESTDDKTLEKFLNGSSSRRKYSRLDNYHFDRAIAEEELKRFFDVTALDGFGLGDTNLALGAGGAILRYLKENRRDTLDHINRISCVEKDSRMSLDSATVRNLELVEPLGHGDTGISLFDVIDKTITPGGARRLKRDLVEPFLKIEPIRKRQEAVGIARSDREGANEIRKTLRIVPDLARLAGRLGIRRFSPRQALSLGQGLQAGREIVSKLKDSGSELLQSLIRTSPDTALVSEKLISGLTENPPLLTGQGGIIRKGASAELDKLNEAIASAKNYMAGLQNSEREATGIPTLRVGFNKVFGYYLEITHKHKNRIPERYIRKQTLVNAERYITEEMKVQEDLIQAAEEKIHKLERELFEKLVEDLIEH
ncbi:MAG: DNA mismatch repair protein MutS, partial [candidate division Zixibacteria bacterium]|nr:DNA mismatch repair protein MutS [candidate division Zixibacteria bacterium]